MTGEMFLRKCTERNIHSVIGPCQEGATSVDEYYYNTLERFKTTVIKELKSISI
jgi:hypothetical protein